MKPKNIKQLAWNAFSKYIRLKNADKNGNVRCITCNKLMHWKESQSGHFVDGRTNSVLFNEELVYPQCYRCNVLLHGNKVMFTLFMLKKYSKKQIEQFERLKNVTLQRKNIEYYDIRDKYKKLVKELEKK